MRNPKQIVVVGASLAGQRAARALRQAGFSGKLTIVGDEKHAPYNRPPLSKGVLRGEVELADITLEKSMQVLEADWLLGKQATSIDVANGLVWLGDEDFLEFDAALIATGGRVRKLDMPGADLDGVYYLRTFDDAERIREALKTTTSLLVIGAGFIGCEVAASAIRMGLSVTVVDPASTPMQRVLGTELGLEAQKLHELHGVRFLMGRTVESLEGSEVVTSAMLTSGERVCADAVVVGIGSIPNTEWLDGSGITCSNGVVCDATCLVPGTHGRIAAAGDVANWPHPSYGGQRMRVEHWSNAVEQGEAAALALIDPASAKPFAPTLSMWSDQYGTKIQAIGAPWLGSRIELKEGSLEAHKFAAEGYLGNEFVGAVLFDMPARVAKYRSWLEECNRNNLNSSEVSA